MKISHVITAFLVIALSGCSTTSPHVGEWTSGELPDPGMMEVIIRPDGTLSFRVNSDDSSDAECISGTWSATSEMTIKIDIPGQEPGTGRILDKTTMEINGGGDTYKIKKK